MAKAKTGSFYLTETVSIPAATTAGNRVQGTVDLGAYVNVPTGQAIAIESVDFVFQTTDTGSQFVGDLVTDNATLSVQLSDLNPQSLLNIANDQSLIASGALSMAHQSNITSQSTDLYPDNHGPAALSEAFMVVNDTLYLVGGVDGGVGGLIGPGGVSVTARIRCRVVKLAQQDWMAIAIQSTAADN